MTKDEFTGKIISELLDDNFSICVLQKRRINKCGGWFDQAKMELKVAYKNKYGFEILIHEYCHYLQWKNDNKFFNEKVKEVGIVFDWLAGEDYSNYKINKAIRNTIELEWDCEKRALELIKSYKLPVDVEVYIKTSNAYLLFYHIVESERKWSKKSPYNDKKILDLVSNERMDLDYYLNKDNITKELRERYLKVL